MTSIAARAPRQAQAPRTDPAGADGARVLVAGRDATQRAAVLDELARTMPPNTVFVQAGAFCQVLERAPASRMVVLSGDLDDGAAESFMHELAHRHPGLPVVSLGAPAPTPAPASAAR